ncbi:MAG: lysylphosphatidylglycerol synthase transmembrane domain-containing protein [Anaerolineae bacterium]
MRTTAITVLKIVISVGLIAWTFSRVPLAEVGSQLASARPGYLLAALLVFVLAMIVNGAKWHVLLRAQGVVIPFARLLEFQFIGFFFNNFLPSANLGGDVMRGYGLARLTDRPADAAISVLVDRIVGFLAYMSSAAIAGIIAVNLVGRQDLRQMEGVALLAALASALVLAMLLSRRLRALITRLFGWRPLAPLARTWGHVSQALDAYRFRLQAVGIAFGIAVLGLLCTALVNWLVSQAMGGQMPLLAIFLFNPLIALVMTLPISIGGLGVSQAAYPFFYVPIGVSADHALAVSLLMQLTQLLASLPGGLFWLRTRRATRASGPSVSGI